MVFANKQKNKKHQKQLLPPWFFGVLDIRFRWNRMSNVQRQTSLTDVNHGVAVVHLLNARLVGLMGRLLITITILFLFHTNVRDTMQLRIVNDD